MLSRQVGGIALMDCSVSVPTQSLADQL